MHMRLGRETFFNEMQCERQFIQTCCLAACPYSAICPFAQIALSPDMFFSLSFLDLRMDTVSGIDDQ